MKSLRVMRLAMHFKSLRAIIASTIGSATSLFWALVALNLVFFVFSLVLVTRVADFLHADIDSELHEDLIFYFGSVFIGMRTMTLASLGGFDWGEPFAVLELMQDWTTPLTYLLMIYFIQVALLNIILGIFVEDAMSRLQPDTLEKAQSIARDEETMEQALRSMCKGGVHEREGKISAAEWESFMKDHRLKNLLEMLGFRVSQVHEFFNILLHQSSDGEGVDTEMFIQGCLQLKGAASSFDMNAVLFKLGSINQAIMQELELLKTDIRMHGK
jgi:hypothetical protein